MISIMETNHDNSLQKQLEAPLYIQIKRKILTALEDGVWKSGELIPSELDLASSYQVSQGTVRKAIDELVAQHLLIRKQGSGTFVATHKRSKVSTAFYVWQMPRATLRSPIIKFCCARINLLQKRFMKSWA